MRRRIGIKLLLTLLTVSVFMVSCSKDNAATASKTTGWSYNDPTNGGFNVIELSEQITGPGLVAIEGGTFTMGATTENVYYEWNNTPRQVTVSSFYMDQTEVSNLDYLEYIHWLNRVYGSEYPEIIENALPDTNVWRNSLSYNEPMVELYFRHPSYRDYPVVGVSWIQANDYALWRSDRVNEKLLIDAGALTYNNDQDAENHFTTDRYLAGLYPGNNMSATNSTATGNSTENKQNIRVEDGVILPKYRLPTEAEWEYAALGLIGNTNNERITERKVYPWNSDGVRTSENSYQGSFSANFKRGRGDYMGVAGNLNDGAAFPAPVASYWPNDYGLYNMAGNVSEWVLDVYRPLSHEDFNDHNPYRGNEYAQDSIYNLNHNDGDYKTTIQSDWNNPTLQPKDYTNQMYAYGVTSLISDNSRVYKGGSWADGAYYLSPSLRHFMNKDESSSTVGFRCAMNKIGSAMAK